MSNKPKPKSPGKRVAVDEVVSGDSRLKKLIVPLLGIILVGGIIAIVLLSPPELKGVPDGTQTLAVGDPVHVEGPVAPSNEVPAGGPHAGIWQNCGFYDSQVGTENILHSMEHGSVWVSYDPNLSSDEIQTLRGFASPNEKVLVTPVPGQSSPIIATAWGEQLELDDVSDPRLNQFVNEFTRGLTAPEPGGTCRGGVGTPQF
ncbi:hypothetical protein MNBD_ACTINO02-1069 [hydrothermal vent metagenome]|uniref:DUF3105 domain-containing protein n=1 Tax=hydrothermal vent metagenome TaxID=652676 RepID=A0A3B0RPG0_9ZZZZ